MNKLKHIIRYLVAEYPNKQELSKARLTKMVYLADWYNALKYKEQMTDISWYFDHYGPYVTDVYKEVVDDSKLSIINTKNQYGSNKQLIEMKNTNNDFFSNTNRLSLQSTEILNKVIEDTKLLYWNDFIQFIYSSYPIKSSVKYNYLNLVDLAKLCREEKIKF